jgi:DNA-binding transcriptional MerR regulator
MSNLVNKGPSAVIGTLDGRGAASNGEERRLVRVLSIGQLEKLSGVPRSTIHFYLSLGLLPRPQKSSTSRSLYTDGHLQILRSISELKEAGFSLAEIEAKLQHRVDEANESAIDLAAQEYQRVHERILSLAAWELTEKGYRDTHVTSIVHRLGITTAVFYSHFASKRALLAECVGDLIDSSLEYVDSKEADTADPAERLLWLCFGHSHVFRLGATALALTRVEEFEEHGEAHKAIRAAFDQIIEHIERDVAGETGRAASSPSVPDELVAHSLFAAYEQTMLRMFALRAARSGEIDIDSRLDRYRGLVKKLASELPPPPALLDK